MIKDLEIRKDKAIRRPHCIDFMTGVPKVIGYGLALSFFTLIISYPRIY
jgi:hypothetical protein